MPHRPADAAPDRRRLVRAGPRPADPRRDRAAARARPRPATTPRRAELTDAFTGRLAFGTAGLRGTLGPGPNRMNRVVVTQAAAGLAAYLRDQVALRDRRTARQVLVGYDARHGSERFARDTGEVLAGRGLRGPGHRRARSRPRSSPSASGTSAASPAWSSPRRTTRRRTTATRSTSATARRSCRRPTPRSPPGSTRSRATTLADVRRSDAYARIGAELLDAYAARAASLAAEAAARATCAGPTRRCTGSAARSCSTWWPGPGSRRRPSSPTQAEPDPDFPTVAFPNPEEPGAIDLALALGERIDADVVVANDPDADRCAVAARFPGSGWRMLTGDELGVLLGEDALRRGTAGHVRVLGRLQHPARDGRGGVRAAERDDADRVQVDRPGARAGVRLRGGDRLLRRPGGGARQGRHDRARPGAGPDRRAEGGRDRPLAERLDEIATTYGVVLTGQQSVRVDDLDQITAGDGPAAGAAARDPRRRAGRGHATCRRAWATCRRPTRSGSSGPTVRVVVRPSGTEPKLKAYLEARVPLDADPRAWTRTVVGPARRSTRLRQEIGDGARPGLSVSRPPSRCHCPSRRDRRRRPSRRDHRRRPSRRDHRRRRHRGPSTRTRRGASCRPSNPRPWNPCPTTRATPPTARPPTMTNGANVQSPRTACPGPSRTTDPGPTSSTWSTWSTNGSGRAAPQPEGGSTAWSRPERSWSGVAVGRGTFGLTSALAASSAGSWSGSQSGIGGAGRGAGITTQACTAYARVKTARPRPGRPARTAPDGVPVRRDHRRR